MRYLYISLSVLFGLSGATSLALEVAWAKALSYVLGNSLFASATVVAAFMGGLGLGSQIATGRFLHRLSPLLSYAGLQLLIGAFGIASPHIFASTLGLFEWLFQHLGMTPGWFLGARFALTFALIAVPVTAMGMTLPLVVAALQGDRQRYSLDGAMLYGVNTLGAVSGTLLAGYVLLPWLGLTATCHLIGMVDISIALALFSLHHRLRLQPGKARPPRRQAVPGMPPGAITAARGVFFAAGLLAMVCEITWFRYLANVFGASTHAFTHMLAVFLVGIALGSLLGARWNVGAKQSLRVMAGLQLLIGVLIFGSQFFYDALPMLYGRLYVSLVPENASGWFFLPQMALAGLVILPPTLAMGMMFPVVLRVFQQASAAAARQVVGRIYALNTLGGIVGSLMAGFIILPSLGVAATLTAVSSVSLALGLGLWGYSIAGARARRYAWGLAGLAVAGGLWIVGPSLDVLDLNRGIFMQLQDRAAFTRGLHKPATDARHLLFYEEGINGSVAVIANEFNDGSVGLRISSKPVAIGAETVRRHLLLLGHLPVFFARHPQQVAVIGFGTGTTTGAVLAHTGVQRVDVVELEAAVTRASRFFEPRNGRPLHDPRTHMVVEDGRIYLQYSPHSYDVITSDPISPWVAGAASLYSTDFYARAAAKLNPGGIFCQWLQMGDYGVETYRGIVASLARIFPHQAIFMYGPDSVILASKTPIQIPWEMLQERFRQPQVQASLGTNGIHTPLQLLNFFMAGTAQVQRLAAAAKHYNSDDNVWLEHRMALELHQRRDPDFTLKVISALLPGRLDALAAMVPGVPILDMAQEILQAPPLRAPRVHPLIKQDVLDSSLLRRQPIAIADLNHWYKTRQTLAELQSARRRLQQESMAALRRHDWPQATALLQQIMQDALSPAYYSAAFNYIKLLARQGQDGPETVRLVRALQARSPAWPMAYLLEYELLAGRNWPAAAAAVQRGLVFNPTNVQLHERLQTAAEAMAKVASGGRSAH